jgi:hypothetical protein
MKLDGHKLGLAAAATSAIIFTACSIIMHLWPMQSIEMSAALFHLSSFGPLTEFFELNAQIFVSGLVQTAVYSYIYVQLFVVMYHHITKKR